jgi:hypothetical protein
VVSIQNTHAFAKAGLMLRETLDPSSAHVVIDVRPTGDIERILHSAAFLRASI